MYPEDYSLELEGLKTQNSSLLWIAVNRHRVDYSLGELKFLLQTFQKACKVFKNLLLNRCKCLVISINSRIVPIEHVRYRQQSDEHWRKVEKVN